jgi:acyl transferase domain-containing protein
MTLLKQRLTKILSNGRTPGITMPSASPQEAVIRKAYSTAGLDTSETDYVECHGTGTAAGDLVEVEALGRCFSDNGKPPTMIGSVSDWSEILTILLVIDFRVYVHFI